MRTLTNRYNDVDPATSSQRYHSAHRPQRTARVKTNVTYSDYLDDDDEEDDVALSDSLGNGSEDDDDDDDSNSSEDDDMEQDRQVKQV